MLGSASRITTKIIALLGIGAIAYAVGTSILQPSFAIDAELRSKDQVVVVHEVPALADSTFYDELGREVAAERSQGYATWRTSPEDPLDMVTSAARRVTGVEALPADAKTLYTMSRLAGLSLQPPLTQNVEAPPNVRGGYRRPDWLVANLTLAAGRSNAPPGSTQARVQREVVRACLKLGPCRVDAGITKEEANSSARAVSMGPSKISVLASPHTTEALLSALGRYDATWHETWRRKHVAY